MIDTLFIGAQVQGITAEDLIRRGWSWQVSYTPKKGIVKKVYLNTDLFKATYLDNFSWVGVEASLPRLVRGDNAVILGADECWQGAVRLWDLARDAARDKLVPLDKCKVSRFDPVWAWEYDPSLYVSALVTASLPRTIPVCYGSSVAWKTPKGTRTRARCYDKAQEQKHPVDLPLRFECQVAPAEKETVRVDGRVIGRAVEEVLSPSVSLGILRDRLHTLGLDHPIPSRMAAKRSLLDTYGPRKGQALWGRLLDLIACQGVWSSDTSPWVRRDCRRWWARAGVSATSPEGELPALVIPQTAG